MNARHRVDHDSILGGNELQSCIVWYSRNASQIPDDIEFSVPFGGRGVFEFCFVRIPAHSRK
jgi:hypothetical protein